MYEKKKDTYGGFLPLELNPGTEWFSEYKEQLRRFNTVKAALDHVINRIQVKQIYIPFYYCPSTIQAVINTGIEVDFYHIDEKLLPVYLPDVEECAVLLVDYFGIMSEKIKELALSFSKSMVIIDSAHSFFSEPVWKNTVYNIYSAKKYFGVPDGAYLLGNDIQSTDEQFEYAADYSYYLFSAYEQGTNSAYAEKKAVDQKLAEHYAPMSILALGLLKNVDYQRVRKIRKDNFEVLYHAFANVNQIKLEGTYPAYVFPLLLENGIEMKKRLIKEKIFVPTLWNGEVLMSSGNFFEIKMAENAIFLPVDQRYDGQDMCYISYMVKEILNENS